MFVFNFFLFVFRASNWVGVLSRGLLMPKIAIQKGANRTDPGMLGSGIYFGSAASTRFVCFFLSTVFSFCTFFLEVLFCWNKAIVKVIYRRRDR